MSNKPLPLSMRIRLALRVLRGIDFSVQPQAGTIYTEARDENNKPAVRGIRSSEDVGRDHHIGDCAIEFFYAVKRGVPITPEVLFEHCISRPMRKVNK